MPTPDISACWCCTNQATPGAVDLISPTVGLPALAEAAEAAPAGDPEVMSEEKPDAQVPADALGRKASTESGLGLLFRSRSTASSRPGTTMVLRSGSSLSTPRRIMLLDGQSSEGLNESCPDVARLVTFQGRKDLLRASHLADVLYGGAAILKNCEGSAHTYSLSEPVQRITAFISHNWVVPRSKKLLCLALYYNFNFALVSASLAIVVIVLATGCGVLPVVGPDQNGIFGTILVAPTFVLGIRFGHKLHKLAQYIYRTPVVFLDKTCIHQVDRALQQQGIRKLGAFIRSSDHMVVIYSDVYLKKLWTVYEVACFLCMHPTDSMVVVPTFQPAALLGGICITYVAHVLQLLAASFLAIDQTVYLVYFLACFPLVAVLRRWTRTRMAIHDHMVAFRVEECICAVEADREVVYSSIALLMRALGAVDSGASDEQTREAFSEFVRQSLPAALESSVGRFGFKYLQIVSMFLCTNLPQSLDSVWSPILSNPRKRIIWVLYSCIWVFGLIPLGAAFLAVWSGRCLRLRGMAEWAYLTSGIFLLMFGMVAVSLGLNILYAGAMDSPQQDVCMVGMAFLLASVVLLAVLVFDIRRLPWAAAEAQEEAAECTAQQVAGSAPAAADEKGIVRESSYEEEEVLTV